jgi:hypothetical protein
MGAAAKPWAGSKPPQPRRPRAAPSRRAPPNSASRPPARFTAPAAFQPQPPLLCDPFIPPPPPSAFRRSELRRSRAALRTPRAPKSAKPASTQK